MTNNQSHPPLTTEVIYTPYSQLRNPANLLKTMLKDLINSRELAWRLFIRNISAQYRQTILGYLWAFLPPIATTLTFVFLNSQKIIDVQPTHVPYPVYVFVGTLLWQVFIDALNSPIKLISTSKEMLTKINFPREALILAGLGEVLFNFLVRFILFIVVFIWFKIPLTSTIFLAPIGIISLILLGLMFGIFLTPLAVLYKDIERSLMIIMSLWFFLTPIVYPIPTSWPASLLTKANPVSPLLITTREWIISGNTVEIHYFCLISIVTFFLTLLGWLLYRLAMPHLIARIGS